MTRPNVFFLMTDQQRWDCLGKFNQYIKTPNLDKLAAQGITFSQAVCQAPMCVPSRNSMMLGLYPSQTGVLTNAGGIFRDEDMPLRPMPQVFQDAGYLTAGFGKTHWNAAFYTGKWGSTRGFEVRAEGHPRRSILYEEGATMMDDEDPEGMKAYYEEVKEYGAGEENPQGYLGRVSAVPKEHHRDGFIAKKALEFLNGYEPDGRPLFFYMSFIKPHAAYNVPKEFEDMYDINEIPDIDQPPWELCPGHVGAMEEMSDSIRANNVERRAYWEKLSKEERRWSTLRYFANCTWLDSYFGQALEIAKEKGLLDNAIITFCSDHGEMMGERNHLFSKYCLYESSVRVPMIVAGSLIPEEKRGTVDERPAELIDLLPTLMNAAGIEKEPRLPGFDLLGPVKRLGAFSQFCGGGLENPMPVPQLMWRNKDVKLILYQKTNVVEYEGAIEGELYDLKNDPHEYTNLFDDPAWQAVKFEMLAQMSLHMMASYAKGPQYGDGQGYTKIGGKNQYAGMPILPRD